ncbi:MAG: hypothetical protein WAN37_17725 [Bryobacteraceae bacterium]
MQISIIGQFLPPIKSEFGFTDTKPLVKGILVIWLVLLIPWLPFAALCGMAFDGGATWEAYTFVWSIWLYPVTLYIGFAFRQKIPLLILLPVLNVIGFFVGGF